MAKKDDLIQKATELNLPLEGNETVPQLETMIEQAAPRVQNTKPSVPTQSTEEKMVPLSVVKQMINEAMANRADEGKPKKVSRVKEHMARMWRLNGKWVVDFADRNYDYDKKAIIDPYIKDKIHAYQIFNAQKREFEAWIKVIFQDGTMEELQLNRYIERRTGIYCTIVKREKVDKSYSIGEVEKKKESGDLNVGTGVMIDQEVLMDGEIFHLRTPEGEMFDLNDYVIC